MRKRPRMVYRTLTLCVLKKAIGGTLYGIKEEVLEWPQF